MDRVVCIILGGGQGKGLYPLTRERAKAAIPFAGKYRMIDIPLSNCINSGLTTIFILTHFNTPSLHSHVTETYHFDAFTRGSVKILAAEYALPHQSPVREGAAQAVRDALEHLTVLNPTHFLVLRGDLLFRLDLHQFYLEHVAAKAEISLAVKPFAPSNDARYPTVALDTAGRVLAYHPIGTPLPAAIEEKNLSSDLGICLYKAETFFELLRGARQDFSYDILPEAVLERKTVAFRHTGHVELLSDIKSFYDQNLALTSVRPQFNLYDEWMPIFHNNGFLPVSKVNFSTLSQSLISDGCILTNSTISNSILGQRTIVDSGAELDGVVALGADFFETEAQKEKNRSEGIPNVGIGKGSFLRKAIIDKNVRIGDGCRIGVDPFFRGNWDYGNYCVQDGIVVIPKGAVIPSGTVI